MPFPSRVNYALKIAALDGEMEIVKAPFPIPVLVFGRPLVHRSAASNVDEML
jgi:hypothetical protein